MGVWSTYAGEGNEDGPGVAAFFSKWLRGLMSIGTLMKRLDTGEGDYAIELEEDIDVCDAMSQLQAALLANEEQCELFKQQFLKYEYLYTKVI